MTWPAPKFSRSQINRAGQILITDIADVAKLNASTIDDWLWAYDVLSNWRACHGYPINTFQATLRNKLNRIDPTALVAQRLKRLPSITKKLNRYPSMSLARMQDIGGLRAVVRTMPQLKDLYENYRESKFSHSLVSEYDYVNAPKNSGYRGIHLVYKYKHRHHQTYDGLQIELQLRTRRQHAWATAVETVGTFLQHSLKSSEGPEEWLQFFSLIGSGFAYLEGTPLVPGYEDLDRLQTFQSISSEAKRLAIRNILVGYSSALQAIPDGTLRGAYYLIELVLKGEQKVLITPFSRDHLEKANQAYSEAEKRIAQENTSQVVLVSAGSVDSLRRAYPNYFLDTHDFLQQLSRIEKMANT